MYNKILKGFASVLGAALVLGAAVTSVVPAQAAKINGTEAVYSLDELKNVKTEEGVSVSGKEISYSGPEFWSKAFFAIPQNVVDAGLVSVSVDLESDNFVFILGDGDCADVADFFGHMAKTIDLAGKDAEDVAKVKTFNIAGTPGSTIPVASVTFKTANAIAGASADDGASKTDDSASKTDDSASKTDDAAPAEKPSSSKTGESTTLLWVVCALGGMLMMAAAGAFVTEQKRR